MIVSMIVAVGKNHEIGHGGKMLWHIKEDFAHFKKTTMGHTLIMGRKTFESIGRPLPGRKTFILSRSNYTHNDCAVFTTLEQALAAAKEAGESEVFIAGGGEIYKQALSLCDRIYLSEVDFSGEADAFFPAINEMAWTDSVEPLFFEKTQKSKAWKLRVLERSSLLDKQK